jgi:hypothetical protein
MRSSIKEESPKLRNKTRFSGYYLFHISEFHLLSPQDSTEAGEARFSCAPILVSFFAQN